MRFVVYFIFICFNRDPFFLLHSSFDRFGLEDATELDNVTQRAHITIDFLVLSAGFIQRRSHMHWVQSRCISVGVEGGRRRVVRRLGIDLPASWHELNGTFLSRCIELRYTYSYERRSIMSFTLMFPRYFSC